MTRCNLYIMHFQHTCEFVSTLPAENLVVTVADNSACHDALQSCHNALPEHMQFRFCACQSETPLVVSLRIPTCSMHCEPLFQGRPKQDVCCAVVVANVIGLCCHGVSCIPHIFWYTPRVEIRGHKCLRIAVRFERRHRHKVVLEILVAILKHVPFRIKNSCTRVLMYSV